MTQTGDLYRARAAEFDRRVLAVGADQWANPSPCEGWTARDVVRHAVDGSNIFLGFVDRSVPPEPTVDEDPVAAWHNARDAILAVLDDPAVATKEFQGFDGPSTFERGITRFIAPDLVAHTWDLARATGGDERLDPDAVRSAHAQMAEFPEHMLRSTGVCGPQVDVPSDADEQTRYLAFIGRRA
jgi:uncharacterized protein (TIGR03086 family)